MSTRSNIAIRRKDGTRKGIYCHFDGYIEGVGITLQLAYNTSEKVEKLLELGNISALGYYTESRDTNENGTIAYHRDRGEEIAFWDTEQEFNYLFDEWEGVWYVTSEKWIEDTFATRMLKLDYASGKETKLLLDAIAEIDWSKFRWADDEFAKDGEVLEQCVLKAKEGRTEQ